MSREKMEYDVVIVGGGPSGLTTAIKLKQLNSDLNVCILEKASEIGAHILRGNVFETRALDELFPNWKSCSSRFIYCHWYFWCYSAFSWNERKQGDCSNQ